MTAATISPADVRASVARELRHLAKAYRRWPGMAEKFAAKGSDGLAEAGLIAVAGMAREAVAR